MAAGEVLAAGRLTGAAAAILVAVALACLPVEVAAAGVEAAAVAASWAWRPADNYQRPRCQERPSSKHLYRPIEERVAHSASGSMR